MELLNNITDQIQTNLASNFDVRANYLYNIYRQNSDKSLNHTDYLDLGCGYGVNSELFGENFENIYCSDFNGKNLVKCQEYMKRKKGVFHITADAQSLPFKNEFFDLVTAFSLIEHVPNQEKMINEALRVLKNNGHLVLQFPNRFFFMELHTGFPFYCLVPDFIRPLVLKITGYTYLSEIDLPSPLNVKRSILKFDPSARVKIIKVIYPEELIPAKFKKIYSVLTKIGIFRAFPFGWMIICTK